MRVALLRCGGSNKLRVPSTCWLKRRAVMPSDAQQVMPDDGGMTNPTRTLI